MTPLSLACWPAGRPFAWVQSVCVTVAGLFAVVAVAAAPTGWQSFRLVSIRLALRRLVVRRVDELLVAWQGCVASPVSEVLDPLGGRLRVDSLSRVPLSLALRQASALSYSLVYLATDNPLPPPPPPTTSQPLQFDTLAR